MENIEVTTKANGYSLTFDGMKMPQGFFYFSKDELLKGFMLHIGLEILDQLNTETMDEFIVAAINWKDNKKCVEEIERLKTSNERKEAAIRSRERDIARLKSKLLDIAEITKPLKTTQSLDEVVSIAKIITGITNSVKSLSKKEQELLDTPEENSDDDDDKE